MRIPVMPNGWPRAMAPPCGFSLSLNGSTPISLADGMTCAANASLISTTSTSSMVSPAQRLPTGLDRPQAHQLGLQGADAGRDDACEGLDPELLGERPRHHHGGRRTVVERAGVPGGYPATLAEHRPQRG